MKQDHLKSLFIIFVSVGYCEYYLPTINFITPIQYLTKIPTLQFNLFGLFHLLANDHSYTRVDYYFLNSRNRNFVEIKIAFVLFLPIKNPCDFHPYSFSHATLRKKDDE